MTIKSAQTLVQEALKEIRTINTDKAYELLKDNKCNLIEKNLFENFSFDQIDNKFNIIFMLSCFI